ncbi:MAG: AAA family ATPase [Gammaproteobacteria bacterium]|nr:AAA family ATPase [Gammaproteobacteria bacterium]MBU1655751.1 AAA family ATPase [Gammaproteobacteria bacterium]MBU1961811.1 AAA family ATPase [Gammaproteobacteria bacterium]
MKILEFRCKNYKAFREETHIAVRPLTLFFGKNNSGKSALMRLPRLLLRALSTRERSGFPVRVDELSYGESFRELIHGSSVSGAASFGIGLEDQGETFDLAATVQNIQNLSSAPNQPREFNVVSHLRLSDPPVYLEWQPSASTVARYIGHGEIPFRGLLPDLRAGQGHAEWQSAIEPWRERAQAAEEAISHLGPVRIDVPRIFESGAVPPLGLGGGGAVALLGVDAALLEQVSAWFQKHMDGWSISLDYAGGAFRCFIRRGGISVNLADAGHGIQQVLPVVVQQLAHQTGSQSSLLDLVEQPELHLHAAAHAPLGDLFLATATQGTTQVLVETHSENLLLRVRRRIAEGAVDPALVALYFVLEQPDGYSTVHPIEILPDGSVGWWPQGVFSEGYEELKALNRAARTTRSATPPA